MGWNSWDAYGLTINEADFKANATVLAELSPFGWTYVLIDEGWYMKNPSGEKLETRDYQLDSHGLLVPASSRFPSASGAAGLRPLADWTHARGLKLGIHIVRGIPKQAVRENLAIADSKFRAGPTQLSHAAEVARYAQMWRSRTRDVQHPTARDHNRQGPLAQVDSPDEGGLVPVVWKQIGHVIDSCLPVSGSKVSSVVRRSSSAWKRRLAETTLPVTNDSTAGLQNAAVQPGRALPLVQHAHRSTGLAEQIRASGVRLHEPDGEASGTDHEAAAPTNPSELLAACTDFEQSSHEPQPL
jgi:hypothetical protein